MKNLESAAQFEAYKQEGKHIFLFSAGWCPDCRVIEPFLPEVEAQYPEFEFIHVDRDDFIDICASHDIYGIPSFLAYENGKETGRFVSKDRKTRQEIEQFIESL